MVLGIGLVSAVIINKSRSDYKTRLQKLKLNLAKTPLIHAKFYETPLKKILTIFIMIGFMMCFNLFQKHYLEDLMLYSQSRIQKSSHQIKIYQDLNLNKLNIQKESFKNIKNMRKNSSHYMQNYSKVSNAIWWIKVVYSLAIGALISDLTYKVILVTKNRIETRSYSRKEWNKTQVLQWSPSSMSMRIVEKGLEKFIHHNQYYSIELHEKPADLKTKSNIIQVMKRGHIFAARKTMIEMGSILGFESNLKIY